jgi:ribose/xylose/arabinose/galactoside ABC-type transport system permease subunit
MTMTTARIVAGTRGAFGQFGTELVLLGLLLTFFLVLSITSPVFLTDQNISNLLKQSSTNGIIALGMMVVIISGGIDLSVGAVAGLVGAVAAVFMVSGMPPVFACAIALILSMMIGAGNAFMIVEGRIPPFIATLGTMTMARGALKLFTGARTINGLPDSFLGFGEAEFIGIPLQVCLWIALATVLAVVLGWTRFGRNVYAIGSSIQVARLSGIHLRANIYGVYALGSLMAGIAGLSLTSRVRMAAPTAGTGYELYAIAAAVIGGASLSGAEGTIPGAILGAVIMTTIDNGGNLLGIDPFVLEIAVGALIVLAVFIDKRRKP